MLSTTFAPKPKAGPQVAADAPTKLRLLGRGLAVFGSYAKVLLEDDEPVAELHVLGVEPNNQERTVVLWSPPHHGLVCDLLAIDLLGDLAIWFADPAAVDILRATSSNLFERVSSALMSLSNTLNWF